ncbi:MAG: PadR family transcriptional regulator [Rothia sp. (in: high G+C Gram-positive bacteria)]|nr:PadR family transcriptional regulator [Rothia sp. (in: high G+C Gram-positive bacteria)]
MTSSNDYPAEWLRGILGPCVLQLLGAGPAYGYALIGALKDAGLGEIKGGTLYPLLTRYEKQGLVKTEWRAGDGGPGRKYFALTQEGRAELKKISAQWEYFSGSVNAIFKETHD